MLRREIAQIFQDFERLKLTFFAEVSTLSRYSDFPALMAMIKKSDKRKKSSWELGINSENNEGFLISNMKYKHLAKSSNDFHSLT